MFHIPNAKLKHVYLNVRRNRRATDIPSANPLLGWMHATPGGTVASLLSGYELTTHWAQL